MIRGAVLACAAACSPLAAADKGLEQVAAGAQEKVDAPQESTGRAKWNGPKSPDRMYPANESHEAPPKQVEAEKPIAPLFPDADAITIGIAFVPDPRVPRHRRAFDIAVSSISSGMQDADYVLDRFAFPWTDASTPGSSERMAQ